MVKNLLHNKILLFCFFALLALNGVAQDWTWMKGSSSVNNLGIYGPLNSVFGNNNPGSRSGAATWTDNSGDLWLFGGDGYASANSGRLSDMWKYTIGTNGWKWIQGHNTENYYGVYGTQGIASSTVAPGGRAYSVSWKDASGNFWLFGGEGYDATGTFGNLSDLWKFNVSTFQWTWVSGSNLAIQNGVYGTLGVSSATNSPGARRLSVGWTDVSGNLWMFGGYGRPASGGDNSLNDLWKFNVSTLQWTWVNGTNAPNQAGVYGTLGTAASANTPGGRYGATAWKDPSNNFWLCNGNGVATNGQSYLSDIWKYNSSTNQWMWVDGPNTVDEVYVYGIKGILSSTVTPGSRYYSASWSDASGNLYLDGGNNGNLANFSDLWRYNITTHDWTWIRGQYNSSGIYGVQGTSSSLNEPGAGYLRACWKDNSSNFWLFGGVGYDIGSNFSNLNELWKTSIPVTVPTASFSFNQTANVCLGSRIVITDQSINSPAAYDYYIDGVFWSYAKNPVLQDPPLVAALTSGTHTITLIVANAAGVSSAISKTISVSPLTASTITRTPSGIYHLVVGSGQTNNSDWSPWVFNFMDPLPAGVTITGVDITYDGVDQGWGGSGFPGVIHFADQQIANAAFTHNVVSYSSSVTASFPYYNPGGNNTVKLYFAGYPGWQGFISNVNVYIHYETSTIKICTGGSVTLTAASGGTRSWSGGVTEGVPFVPPVSSIYTVTSTDPNTCVSTNTISVVIETATISAYVGEVCSGTSFTIMPSGAATYTFSGGSSIVSPTVNTTYSITGRTSIGCPASNTAVVTVTVDTSPVITVNSGNLCPGGASVFTITASGAVTYTNLSLFMSMPSSMTVAPSVSTSYNIAGTAANGCITTTVSTVGVNAMPTVNLDSKTICAGLNSALSANNSYGLRFDGYDDLGYTSIYYLNDFTMEYWMRTTMSNGGTPGTDQWYLGTSIADGKDYYSGADDMGTSILGNKLAFGVGNPDMTIYSTSSINTGNWVHVAVSWEQLTGIIKLYINGVLEANGTSSATNMRYFSTLVLGSNVSGSSYFNGDLDDFRIWNEVRTSTNILTDMNSCLTGAETNLFLSHTIEEGPGSSILYDQSYYGNYTYLYNFDFQNAWVGGANICGSIPPYTSYLWMPGALTTPSITININAPTIYSLTITDSYSCAATVSQTIAVKPSPTITVNSGSICPGITFTMNPSGSPTYTYSGGNATVSPVSTTNYSVSGTNSLGCIATAISTVVVNPIPALNITGNNTVCLGSSVTQTVNGANSYVWNTGPSTSTVTVSPSVNTTYTVTGTSAAGCTNTATKAIIVNATPTIAVSSGAICTGKSFTINPSGAATYTVISNPFVVSPLVNTSYSVTGTDGFGCISSSPAVLSVTVNALPTIAVNNGSVCAGSPFTITPTGANTYTFLNGSTVVSPTTSSSYSVVGTNSLGCVSSNTAIASLTVNTLPLISVNNGSLCSGKSFTLVPTGVSTYTFLSGASVVSPTVSTSYSVIGSSSLGCVSSNTAVTSLTVSPSPNVSVNNGTICAGNSFSIVPTGASTYTFLNGAAVVSPTSAASYSIIGASSLGCPSSNTAIASLIVNPLPVISVNNGTICAGSSFTLIPTGANTYTYLNGISVVSPTSSTTYSVAGTSVFGCLSANPGTAAIAVNSLPVLSITGPAAFCSGSTISETVTGANTYSWSTGSTSTIITISPTVSTIYNVTGTNTATGCFNTVSRIINIGYPPVINVNSGNVCSGGTFIMSPSGAFTYTYSNGTTTVLSTVSPTANTSYFVSGTSSLGCVSTSSAISNVIVNASPVIVVNSGGVCAGKIFTMTPTGASTYTFSNGSSTVIPVGNNSYTVTGTNVLGCISTAPGIANVTVNPLPAIAASNGTVCSGNNYSIAPTGAASYTYVGPSGPTSPWVAPVANTNYSITGITAQGCISSAPTVITVSVISLPTISVNSSTVCSGAIFTITPTGASTYTYSSGASTVIPSGNNSYSVMGTSSLGCVSLNAAVASVTLVATPFITVNNGVICAGKVFTMVPAGASTYTYSSLSATVAPLSNTSYTVSGTSSLGCVSSNAAISNVVVNPSPFLSIIGNSVMCYGDNTTLIATGANSYTWNSTLQGSIQSFTPTSNTVYTLSGTGFNNCINSTTLSILVNPLPVLSLNTGTVCPSSTFAIIPTGGLTYTFSSGSNIVSPAITTSYSVTGTDANGCVSSLPAVTTITVINSISLSVSGTTIICIGSQATLSVNGANTYTWNNGALGNTIVATPTVNSTYTVIGADGSCADTAFISVKVNPIPTLHVATSSSLICSGENSTLTVSGANNYQWSGGETTTVILVNPTVTTVYTVTGVDANGCSNKIMLTQNVSDCLGIKNLLEDLDYVIKLYPNPNNGEFTVEIPKPLKITVLSTLGQIVFEKQLIEGKNNIVLEDQAKGIYFIEFKNDKQVKTVRVIKQ